jgi:putative protease
MRKKSAPAKKKAAAKKTTVRRVAPKKKPAARRAVPIKKPAPRPAPAQKARPVSPTPRPAAPAVPPAAPAPLAGEERVGVVTHYFSQISVAIVRLELSSLRVGDTIHITGHTSDFRQRVESLQVEHQSVPEVGVGQEIGLKVIEHAREHDVVYKMTAPQP